MGGCHLGPFLILIMIWACMVPFSVQARIHILENAACIIVGFLGSPLEENMKIQINAIRPQTNMIKLMDSIGNITTVSLNTLDPCTLERYMLGVKLPQDVILGDDEMSRFMVSRMAQSGIVFKIAE